MRGVPHPGIGEGTAALEASLLPSVVEHLCDDLNDLMSPVQPLQQTQAE